MSGRVGQKQHRLPRRLWAPDEDKKLIEMYKSYTNAEIGKHLGRTESAVNFRVWKLRTAGQIEQRQFTDYSPEEDELLHKLCEQRVSLPEAAEALGRSTWSVRKRAQRIGIEPCDGRRFPHRKS